MPQSFDLSLPIIKRVQVNLVSVRKLYSESDGTIVIERDDEGISIERIASPKQYIDRAEPICVVLKEFCSQSATTNQTFVAATITWYEGNYISVSPFPLPIAYNTIH